MPRKALPAHWVAACASFACACSGRAPEEIQPAVVVQTPYWGGPCRSEAECPPSGAPGLETFCDPTTGGSCLQVNGPDFVTESEPCRSDSASVGLILGTSRTCLHACDNDGDCRPGYFCQKAEPSLRGGCLAIRDCALRGCNALAAYYCQDDATPPHQLCWVDACIEDPCGPATASTGGCLRYGDGFACACAPEQAWDGAQRACVSFACSAIDLGAYAGAPISRLGDDTCPSASRRYDPGPGGCTGRALPGAEMVYALELSAHTQAQITALPYDAGYNPALYALTACNDRTGATCAPGMGTDTAGRGSAESISLANSGDSAAVYFVVLDSSGADACGAFDLDIQ